MESCQVPVSAHIVVDDVGVINAEYEYTSIDARSLADLLLRGFGIDAEEIATVS